MRNNKGKDANSGGENSLSFIWRTTDHKVTASSRQNLKTLALVLSENVNSKKNAIDTLGVVSLTLLVNFQSVKGVRLLGKCYYVNLIEQKVAASQKVTYKLEICVS